MTVRILIVGAGAIGAYYASRLALNDETEVSVVCRSNYSVVAKDGFSISSAYNGNYTFVPHKTFASTREAVDDGAIYDYIIVSTKALPDVGDDSVLLEGLVHKENTAIVLIQNGLGVEEPYAKRFPFAPILSAVTMVSAGQKGPGQIVHHRWSRVCIGPYVNPHTAHLEDSCHTATEKLVQLFRVGGIKDAEHYSALKMQLLRWHKLAINISMNPSGVLSGGCRSSEMMADDELRIMIKGVVDEVFTTAERVTGSPMPEDFATSERIIESFKRNQSDGKSSTLLDWELGKRLELEVILGNPLRAARQIGVEMPRTQMLYALLRMAQQKRYADGESKI